MSDDLVVYRVWSRETIHEAVTEFNEQMHDGAGIPELQAGLHGLDFLTRRSVVDDDLQARLDGAVVEARMRIELLLEKEAEDRTAEEQRERALKTVELLQKQLASYYRRFIEPGMFDPDDVRRIVALRIAARNPAPE